MEQDSSHKAAAVGDLGRPGYRSRSVKQGMGENLIARLKNGDPVLDGIISHDDTLIPQVANAIFRRHDVLVLGFRGQGKARMMRLVPSFLDEWSPTFRDHDMPDDPLDSGWGLLER